MWAWVVVSWVLHQRFLQCELQLSRRSGPPQPVFERDATCRRIVVAANQHLPSPASERAQSIISTSTLSLVTVFVLIERPQLLPLSTLHTDASAHSTAVVSASVPPSLRHVNMSGAHRPRVPWVNTNQHGRNDGSVRPYSQRYVKEYLRAPARCYHCYAEKQKAHQHAHA